MNTIIFGLMTLASLFSSSSFAQPKELLLYKSEDNLKEKLVLELNMETNKFRMYSNTNTEMKWTINRFSGNWIQNQDTLVLTLTDVIAHRRNERRIIEQLDQNERTVRYLSKSNGLRLIGSSRLMKHKRFELKE